MATPTASPSVPSSVPADLPTVVTSTSSRFPTGLRMAVNQHISPCNRPESSPSQSRRTDRDPPRKSILFQVYPTVTYTLIVYTSCTGPIILNSLTIHGSVCQSLHQCLIPLRLHLATHFPFSVEAPPLSQYTRTSPHPKCGHLGADWHQQRPSIRFDGFEHCWLLVKAAKYIGYLTLRSGTEAQNNPLQP
jgi:hypothetical protein